MDEGVSSQCQLGIQMLSNYGESQVQVLVPI